MIRTLVFFLITLGASAQDLFYNGSFEDNFAYCINGHSYTSHLDSGYVTFDSIHYLSESVPYAWGMYHQDCFTDTLQTYWNTPFFGGDSAGVEQFLIDNPSRYGFVYGDGLWDHYPQDGEWYISLSAYDSTIHQGGFSTVSIVTGFSMALTQPLEVGAWYELSYYIMGPLFPYSGSNVADANAVKIGLSNDKRLFGDSIHLSYLPVEEDTTWILQKVCFQAQQAYDYLTAIGYLHDNPEYMLRALFLDNFSLRLYSPCETLTEPSDTLTQPTDTSTVSVQESVLSAIELYPNPTTGYVRIESAGSSLAVYDLLGKEHYRSEMHDTHSLFIEDWSQGVYVVKTYDSQGKLVGAQKLIKNK